MYNHVCIASAFMDEDKPKLHVRRVPGAVYPKHTNAPRKAVALVQAFEAARVAIAAEISAREVVEWYYGDGEREKATKIETALNPELIAALMWLSGYRDPNGAPPVSPDSEILNPQRVHWPEIVTFIESLREAIAEKQGRRKQVGVEEKLGPKGVIGEWVANERSRS